MGGGLTSTNYIATVVPNLSTVGAQPKYSNKKQQETTNKQAHAQIRKNRKREQYKKVQGALDWADTLSKW